MKISLPRVTRSPVKATKYGKKPVLHKKVTQEIEARYIEENPPQPCAWVGCNKTIRKGEYCWNHINKTYMEKKLNKEQERKCRVCGCTEERACEGGCSWAGRDICSECA